MNTSPSSVIAPELVRLNDIKFAKFAAFPLDGQHSKKKLIHMIFGFNWNGEDYQALN